MIRRFTIIAGFFVLLPSIVIAQRKITVNAGKSNGRNITCGVRYLF